MFTSHQTILRLLRLIRHIKRRRKNKNSWMRATVVWLRNSGGVFEPLKAEKWNSLSQPRQRRVHRVLRMKMYTEVHLHAEGHTIFRTQPTGLRTSRGNCWCGMTVNLGWRWMCRVQVCKGWRAKGNGRWKYHDARTNQLTTATKGPWARVAKYGP